MKRFLFIATAALLIVTLGLIYPSAAIAASFTDNFTRADSNTVGNGWSELELSADDMQIISNRLVIGPNGNEADAAVAYRARGSGYNTNNTTLVWGWIKPSTADNLTEFDPVSVSHNGSTRAGGIGLWVEFQRSSGTNNIIIYDNGTAKGTYSKTLSADTEYFFRWDIESDYSMRLYVRSGDTAFVPADLLGTVAAFTPGSVSGANYGLGNRFVSTFTLFTAYDSVQAAASAGGGITSTTIFFQ